MESYVSTTDRHDGGRSRRRRVRVAAIPVAILTLLGGIQFLDRFLPLAATAGPVATATASSAPPQPIPASRAIVACIGGGTESAVACGVVPPVDRGSGQATVELSTVTGERVRVSLPDDALPGPLVAIQELPLGGIGSPGRRPLRLTTMSPRSAAASSCPGTCRPRAVSRTRRSNGAVVTQWYLGGDAPPRRLITIRMGIWTAVVEDAHPRIVEFVAGVIDWRIEEGFLVVESSDPTYPVFEDWAGVRVEVSRAQGRSSVTVTPGCALSRKRPNPRLRDLDGSIRAGVLRGSRGGEWCASGRYWVRVENLGERRLRALHRGLAVRPPVRVPASRFAQNARR